MTTVEQVLDASAEAGTSEDPEELRACAARVSAEYEAAVASLPGLSMAAATMRARATAIEKAQAARGPVLEAAAAVLAAEDAFAATAAPEEDAAGRCVAARHQFEAARDALGQAQASGAEPAELVDLDMRAMSAARVDQHEQRALANAQSARESARRELEAARAALTRARAALAAAETAIDAPLAADRPLDERMVDLAYTHPLRVGLHFSRESDERLDEKDLALARRFCLDEADLLGVVPVRLAWQIAAAVAKQAACGQVGAKFVLPFTGEKTTIKDLLDAAGR